jgi:hypothetical protein
MKLPVELVKIKVDTVFKIRAVCVAFIVLFPLMASNMFDVNSQGSDFQSFAFAVGIILPLGGFWYANKLSKRIFE